MVKGKFDIFVYVHWYPMPDPKFIGVLSALNAKGRKTFSFEYHKDWLKSKHQLLLDPDIRFYSGPQFPHQKENFGVFLDSMPDTWGRTLMKRRAVQLASEIDEKAPTLYEIDYLLGVSDEARMGALRFKTDPNGPFLDNCENNPIPPISSVRELQEAAKIFETGSDNSETKKWLDMLIAPGSSLGGARPKANVVDESGNLCIAKFPSKNDTIDKAAWEYLAYRLALGSGIEMAPSRIEKIMGNHHTFFTRRFDRLNRDRIHFSSAMTMTGNTEETIRDNPASYLDIAEFIQNHGACVEENLHQLWRRIAFNIATSNTDDHLRNHGFILTSKGWVLSPAYDINPSIDKDGLALMIDMDSNSLSLELAKSIGDYFRLGNAQMDTIIEEVLQSVSRWKKIANEIGIPRGEQELMKAAFLTG